MNSYPLPTRTQDNWYVSPTRAQVKSYPRPTRAQKYNAVGSNCLGYELTTYELVMGTSSLAVELKGF